MPEAVPTVTFAKDIANNARIFAPTGSKSVQHCVGDRNSCSDLVRGSCRSTSEDVETPQPLQIKYNRGIRVRDRSVVSSEGFGQQVVRARGGALNFNDNGLNVNDYNDDNRNNNVAASAALPSRNFCLPFYFCLTLFIQPPSMRPISSSAS